MGPLTHLSAGQAAKGMVYDYGLKVGTAKGPGLDERRAQEGSSTDHHSGYAAVLQAHRVVHTARGAGPSISNGRDHEVTTLGQIIDDIFRWRAGSRRTYGQDQRVLEFEAFFQHLPDVPQQQVCVVFTVAQKAAGFTVQT